MTQATFQAYLMSPSPASLPVVPNDPDCDGFSPPRRKGCLGTDPESHCSATEARNDEPPGDPLPVDFDDNQLVNTADVGRYVLVLNSCLGRQSLRRALRPGYRRANQHGGRRKARAVLEPRMPALTSRGGDPTGGPYCRGRLSGLRKWTST